jgi:hypothetical protein
MHAFVGSVCFCMNKVHAHCHCCESMHVCAYVCARTRHMPTVMAARPCMYVRMCVHEQGLC